MKTIVREEYMKRLRALEGQNLIKVITGVRRCGKSTLLRLRQEELVHSGISEERVQYINFEDPKYSYNVTWKDIYDSIMSSLVPGCMNYIFLDEVQYVDDFERLLVGLQTNPDIDLYVTGSNAHMLSSELATLLSGRSIEISMLPFSFKEYLEVFSDSKLSVDEHFSNFLSFGGFPQAVSIFEQSPESIDTYLSGIYETVVGRDIMDRDEVSDKIALNTVTRYLLDNIGNPTSINSVADVLGISRYKIEQIINALVASFLFYRLNRYDLKGKELLKTQEKYYSVDLGLRWAMLGRDAASDMGKLLENVVFLELKRRGGKVLVGRVGDREVDFVVRTPDGKTAYYQVAWTVGEKSTLERELAPFSKISDHNPCFLITTDKMEVSYDGVQQLDVVKWLLGRTDI